MCGADWRRNGGDLPGIIGMLFHILCQVWDDGTAASIAGISAASDHEAM